MDRRKFLTSLAAVLPATWAARLLPAVVAAPAAAEATAVVMPAAGVIKGLAYTLVAVAPNGQRITWSGRHTDFTCLLKEGDHLTIGMPGDPRLISGCRIERVTLAMDQGDPAHDTVNMRLVDDDAE